MGCVGWGTGSRCAELRSCLLFQRPASQLMPCAWEAVEGLVVGLKRDKEPWSEGRGRYPPGLVPGQPHTPDLLGVAGLGPLCEAACAWPTDGGHVHTVLSHGQSSAGLSVGLGDQSRCEDLRSSGKPRWGEPRLWGTS